MAKLPAPHARPLFLTLVALGAGLLGFLGGWTAQLTGVGQGRTEAVVRDYILQHPEILPQAMERLHQREQAKRLEPLREQVAQAFPGAVLGNPKGSRVLVEFSDYACGYCRQSVADVQALIAADPQLKVVIREFPILSQESVDAARMALAAAEQGKFAAFHDAMFAQGRPGPATIEAAGRKAGLDMARARSVASSPQVEAELASNVRLAEALGFSGTPSWVAGDQALSGALGRQALAEALARVK